jgi:hypothetical protein
MIERTIKKEWAEEGIEQERESERGVRYVGSWVVR